MQSVLRIAYFVNADQLRRVKSLLTLTASGLIVRVARLSSLTSSQICDSIVENENVRQVTGARIRESGLAEQFQ